MLEIKKDVEYKPAGIYKLQDHSGVLFVHENGYGLTMLGGIKREPWLLKTSIKALKGRESEVTDPEEKAYWLLKLENERNKND